MCLVPCGWTAMLKSTRKSLFIDVLEGKTYVEIDAVTVDILSALNVFKFSQIMVGLDAQFAES